MKTYFLHKSQSKILIIFMSGFASHYSHFIHLDSKHNVIMCYDYRDFYIDIDMKGYDQIILVAYSMGVCIATKLFKYDIFNKKIALSGTNLAINREYGINPAIFRHTIKNLNFSDFKKTIFGDNESKTNNFFFEKTDILRQELQSLYDFCLQDTNNNFKWNKAYISLKDSIFLPTICNKFFANKTKIHELNTWHYPFFMFNTWEEICNIE